MFSELNTPPGCTSVNASPCRLPDNTHHSRPRRLARSYLVRLLHSLLFTGFRRRTPSPLVRPKRLTELTTSADKEVSAKAMGAMMKQMKIDIAAIEAAVRD